MDRHSAKRKAGDIPGTIVVSDPEPWTGGYEMFGFVRLGERMFSQSAYATHEHDPVIATELRIRRPLQQLLDAYCVLEQASRAGDWHDEHQPGGPRCPLCGKAE